MASLIFKIGDKKYERVLGGRFCDGCSFVCNLSSNRCSLKAHHSSMFADPACKDELYNYIFKELKDVR